MKEKSLYESPVSNTSSSRFSSPSPALSLTSLQTPVALCWLVSSNYLVGSTLTQFRLHSSSSSSSTPASSVKARLPHWHKLPLITRMGISSISAQIFLWHWLNLISISSVDPQPDWQHCAAAALKYGHNSTLALTPCQLSTSFGFDSSLLLNLKHKRFRFPIKKLTVQY